MQATTEFTVGEKPAFFGDGGEQAALAHETRPSSEYFQLTHQLSLPIGQFGLSFPSPTEKTRNTRVLLPEVI
jgi:hypothetical protein